MAQRPNLLLLMTDQQRADTMEMDVRLRILEQMVRTQVHKK